MLPAGNNDQRIRFQHPRQGGHPISTQIHVHCGLGNGARGPANYVREKLFRKANRHQRPLQRQRVRDGDRSPYSEAYAKIQRERCGGNFSAAAVACSLVRITFTSRAFGASPSVGFPGSPRAASALWLRCSFGISCAPLHSTEPILPRRGFKWRINAPLTTA